MLNETIIYLWGLPRIVFFIAFLILLIIFLLILKYHGNKE